MRYLALLVLLLSFSADAQQSYPRDIELFLTWPSLYEDGSEIQDGDLVSARISCTRHDGVLAFETEMAISVLPGETQGQVFSGDIPKPGKYSCWAFVVTIDGTESDISNVLVKPYTGKPNPGIVSSN